MTTATHDTALAQPQGIRAAEPSLLRRMTRGLGRFARRSRMSAFWGVIAAAIVVIALAIGVWRYARRRPAELGSGSGGAVDG